MPPFIADRSQGQAMSALTPAGAEDLVAAQQARPFTPGYRPHNSGPLDFHTSAYQSPDLRLQLAYSEGYLIYQVHRTPERFQSTDFKLREFQAANGLRIISKNSPLYIGAECIALHGAFREFDLKPTVAYIGTWEQFVVARSRVFDACDDLRQHLYDNPEWRPVIVEARDGIEDK